MSAMRFAFEFIAAWWDWLID